MKEAIKVSDEVHEKITNIQNVFWKSYKDFRVTKDMRQHNNEMDALMEMYKNDNAMYNFCDWLRCAWSPIINGIKELS